MQRLSKLAALTAPLVSIPAGAAEKVVYQVHLQDALDRHLPGLVVIEAVGGSFGCSGPRGTHNPRRAPGRAASR